MVLTVLFVIFTATSVNANEYCFSLPPSGGCIETMHWCDFECTGQLWCDTHAYECPGPTYYFYKGCCSPEWYGNSDKNAPLNSPTDPTALPVFALGWITTKNRRKALLVAGLSVSLLLAGAFFFRNPAATEIPRMETFTLTQEHLKPEGQNKSRWTITQKNTGDAYVLVEVLLDSGWASFYEGWMHSDNTSVQRRYDNGVPLQLQYSGPLTVGSTRPLTSSIAGTVDGSTYGVPFPVKCVEKNHPDMLGKEFSCSSPVIGLPVYSKTTRSVNGADVVVSEIKTVNFQPNFAAPVPNEPEQAVSFRAFRLKTNDENTVKAAKIAFTAKGRQFVD